MKFGQKITLNLLFFIILCNVTFAQVVDIPDPNLRATIADALNITPDAPITQQDMLRLTNLAAYARDISNLSGLEAASNLDYLALGQNPISDLSPLAGLPLRGLVLPDCMVTDISPLSNLTHIEELNLRGNPISDISPLGAITTLHSLDLSHCQIIDISPLSNLLRIEVLQLNHNQIVDVGALAHLTSLYKLEIGSQLYNQPFAARFSNA